MLPKNIVLLALAFSFFLVGCRDSDARPSVTSPDPPSTLIATAVSDNQVNLQWDYESSDQINGFSLERSTSPNGGFSQVTTTGGGVRSISDAVSGSSEVYYRIRAFQKKGQEIAFSPYSNVSGASLDSAPPSEAKPAPILSPGSFEFSSLSYKVGKGDGKALITINRLGGSDGEVTVDWKTNDLTAQSDVDYEGVDWATLTFADGEDSRTESITIFENGASGDDKTFNVILGNANNGATLGDVTTAEVIILGNEVSYPAAVLESVVADGSNFVLNWSQPGSEMPSGGYDIFINGVDTGATHRTTQLTATISGLATGKHCFEIEGRWLQVSPSQFPLSNNMCATSGSTGETSPSPAPAPDPAPAPSTRTNLSLRIDSNFSRNQLSAEARLWYDRFWAGLQSSRPSIDATALAQSNNVYDYGRRMNNYITSILQVLRVTGDQRLLDEVDRLAQLMRAELKDWSIITRGGTKFEADGYLNWLYLREQHADYHETDVHEMDEMLAHSLVASIAYAFHVNRDLDPRYAERAKFWTNYLKNHFEAKWRARNKKATGFPFLSKNLAHAHTQWIRYHFFMHHLTGEQGYLAEAQRMTDLMAPELQHVSTSSGTATIWDHRLPLLGGSKLGIQTTSYARYTVQVMAELAAERFSIFGQPGFMERVAVTLSHFIMDSTSSYAGRIDGSGDRETYDRYAISPWAQLGRWDKSGKIKKETDRVYRLIESTPENPRRIYLPGGMVFQLLQ
jgi:hypothetical protein